MAFNAKKHERVIQDTLADIKAGAFDDLKALENAIAELVSSGLPADQIRGPLTTAFNKTKLELEASASPVTGLSTDTLNQSKLPVSIADDQASAALADQTARTVGASVDSGIENVMEVIVLGTAAGVARDLMVRQVRGRISGVFMDSNDPVVRKAQRKLKALQRSGKAKPADVAQAVNVIRDRLTGVNTTASIRDLTSKTVQDTVMKFDAAFIAGRAERAGIEKFEYSGGIQDNSRPFCMDLTGETMTKEEIYDLWDGSSWAGKEAGDPFIVRGGYNCTHFWVPIEDD